MNGIVIKNTDNKADYLSNECTATYLETTVNAGDSYTVPNDGYYYLICYNNDPNNSRSGTFSINNATLLRNNMAIGIGVVIPLKKGTVLRTRSNTSNTNDDFQYRVVSMFVP